MAAMKVEFLHQYHRHHRALAARPARRAPAALRARGRALRAAAEPARPRAGAREAVGGRRRLRRAAERCRSGGATISARASSPTRRGERRRRARSCCSPTPSIRTSSPRTCAPPSRCSTAGGYAVRAASARDGRALCCGRTYLATGMIEAARAEARRLLDALAPFVGRGVRDRRARAVLHPRAARRAARCSARAPTSAALARAALTFEEFLVARACGRTLVARPSGRPPYARALVHGHCHQKAFGAMPAVVAALKLVPGLTVEVVPSSCCGMAGAFGYRPRAPRRVAAHGRGRAAAGRSQRRRRYRHRRRRHELPAPDPRRRAARRAARRARARRRTLTVTPIRSVRLVARSARGCARATPCHTSQARSRGSEHARLQHCAESGNG